MKFIGVYDYTVILTYISLLSGLMGIRFAMEGRPGAAICCLMVSGFLDMFDGAVARTKKNRTADEKNFGIQLDSLCDLVCFGVLPAVYLYQSGVNTWYGMILLFFYVLCALIRLAFFNVLEIKRQMSEGGCAKGYRGLPVTSASMIFPFFYLLRLLGLAENEMLVIHYVLPIVIGLLFILDFHIPKWDVGKLFQKKH